MLILWSVDTTLYQMLFVVAIFCPGCNSVAQSVKITQRMGKRAIQFQGISKQFHTEGRTKHAVVKGVYKQQEQSWSLNITLRNTTCSSVILVL